MATYIFTCEDHGPITLHSLRMMDKTYEFFVRMTKCLTCGKQMRQVFQPPAIIIH